MPEEQAAEVRGGKGHLERWLADATLCLKVDGGRGQLALVPVDRSGEHPRHAHARAVATPIDLDALASLGEAIADLVGWARRPPAAGELLIIIPPSGRKEMKVLTAEGVGPAVGAAEAGRPQ
jgi:hypothetical protein